MPKHFHIHVHIPGLETIMAALDDLNAKLSAIQTNLTEQADEVARIGTLIADIRTQLEGGLSAEQAATLGASLDELVTRTQTVEDSLRSTT
jgi:ABC-type phosphate transport system auxiliary subunit